MSESEDTAGYLRIGELSRRVGVGVEALRAWERRYGLLSPSRTSGGFRLYSDRDLRRVERMQEHLNAGLSAAQAARLALEGRAPSTVAAPSHLPELDRLAHQLRAALDAFGEEVAHDVFDRALASFSLDAVLRDLLLPYLHELGERWARGEASIAQEHFASALLRGRLLGLARDWGDGAGPRALLACVPGEAHDLGLICFGLALAARRWRVVYLGADTPVESLAEAAVQLDPTILVLYAVTARPGAETVTHLAALARSARLAIAGAAADPELVGELGAELLVGDPVTAAHAIASAAGTPGGY